ncbi:MAG: YciI family protein [Acidobacteriia bacterium]|nr:YciI family protein [Terriglobia bacterium]
MRKLILLLALFSIAALAQSAATGQFLLRIEPTRTGFTLQNMSPEEARLATQHVQYLKSLLDAGKLSLAAQVFDPKGLWGILIVNAPDPETARALLEGDPMVKAKMFRGEAIPLRVVFEKPAESSPAAAVDVKTLDSYAGTYKSDQIPLDIKTFVKDGKLYMQASGQPEFPLKATSATQFEFAQAGIVVEFDSSSSFTLKQGGANSRFKKAVTQ